MVQADEPLVLGLAQVLVAVVMVLALGTGVFGDPIEQSFVTGLVIGLSVAVTYYVAGRLVRSDAAR